MASTSRVGDILSINGFDMYYEVHGEGSPLLLLHGFTDSGAELVDGFQLIMPVLAISGQHSVGDKLPKALENQTTSLKSIIVKDSGHFVAEETPETFNSAVIEFLENSTNRK